MFVCLFFFQQPAGPAKGNVDMGASTNKDEGDTEDKEEKKPGTSKNVT